MVKLLLGHLPWSRQLRAYLGQSIRRQLVWAFGVVSALTMLTFTYLLYTYQRDVLYATGNDHTVHVARSLASSSASWVLAEDVAGLQEVLNGFSGDMDFVLAFVLSPRGEVLASTVPSQIGLFVSDPVSAGLLGSAIEPKLLVNTPELIDAAYPVMAGDRHIGWARIEMTRHAADANLNTLRIAGLGFSLLAIVLSIILSRWLGRRLTIGLNELKQATERVEGGQRDVRSRVRGNDEVAVLAQSFNRMLESLEESERNLGRVNRLYAAWTECSNLIVREVDEVTLLERVCEILVERVPFKLAWIGQANAQGVVSVIASSNRNSTYLSQLTIVTDAKQPMGQGPMGIALREGRSSIQNDFVLNPDVPWYAMALAENFNAVAAFPIRRGGAVFAAIAVYSEEHNYFSSDLITLMQGLAYDVSYALENFDRERQRQAANAELLLAARVFQHSKEGILVTDGQNRIISVNQSFTEITGYAAEEVIGKDPAMLASARQDRDFYQAMWHSIALSGGWQGELWNRRRNGEVYPELLTINCVRNEQGEIVNYIGIFSDISERKLAEERIQHLAHYDTLTGLPNRALFGDRLQQALIYAQRNQSSVALLFMDLDRFKQINDTLGHGIGDQLLQMVAQRLLECIREQDTVSRQGGDEFIAVLPGTDAAGAEMVAEKILASIIQPYTIEGHELRISSSIGISLYPDHAQDADALIKYADVAMYQAKENGRNKYLHFDPSMNATAYERLQLENSLRGAIERNELQLYYQPQVDLIDGRLIGCEALVRWKHPAMGLVSPASFIPIAEETGLIIPISDWILEEALRQARAWRDAGLPELVMSVNLSALQFRQGNLQAQVDTLLKRYELPAHVLDLELTEGVLMQGVERTLSMLHELTMMGVGLSIDDFGTGYSSLSYLKRFPIQKLKIDQSFVRDVISDSNDATMVRTIILMAHSLKLHVIAEGVETEAQADFLRQAGCERAQGYYFGRPMPAEAFVDFMSKRKIPVAQGG